MKEHPILFSAPMVRAILEGRKTQTRRILTRPRIRLHNAVASDFAWMGNKITAKAGVYDASMNAFGALSVQVEDKYLGIKPGEFDWMCPYASGMTELRDQKWHVQLNGDRLWVRPSIHMPRWASRIALDVIAVRIERLQDIGEEDALAEGIGELSDGGAEDVWIGIGPDKEWPDTRDPRVAFHGLWNRINGKRAPWDANPWVWVVEFRLVEANP